MARCPTESEKTLRVIAGLFIFFLPFTLLCLLLSIFEITALYTAVPAFVGFATCVAAATWYARTQQVIAQREQRKQELTAMATVAVPLTALFITSLILTLSPYTMPMSNVVVARLGAASDSSINIWARSPPPASEFYVRCRPSGAVDSSWVTSTSAVLSEASDYSATLTVTGLAAATVYEFVVEFDDEASEHAPENLRGTFKTLPTAHEPASFRFASGSCLMKEQSVGYELEGLAAVKSFRPDFWLNLGDIIYADVPITGGIGTSVSGYHALYRRTIQDQHMRALQLSTPGFYQIDDHEITNDITNRQTTRADTLQAGLGAWRTYFASTNPTEEAALFGFAPREGEEGTYFSFAAGDSCFFVLDTRTEQADVFTPPVGWSDAADGDGVSLPGKLGVVQLTRLQHALLAAASGDQCVFKVLMSPVPVTPNYSYGREGWGGHGDLNHLLSFIKAHDIQGVVWFSADAHVLGLYELAAGVVEISASPYSAGSPPFNTIGGERGQILWEQDTFASASRGKQFAVVDVDTTSNLSQAGPTDGDMAWLTSGPVMRVRLYTGVDEFAAPEVEITISSQGGRWAITGGTKREQASAMDHTQTAAAGGDAPLVPNERAGSPLRGFAFYLSMLTCVVAMASAACFCCCPCAGCQKVRLRASQQCAWGSQQVVQEPLGTDGGADCAEQVQAEENPSASAGGSSGGETESWQT